MFQYICNSCKSALRVLVLGVTILVASWASAQTAVVRVDGASGSASPSGFGDGWGANHAYLYLQDGLARASFLIEDNRATAVQVWVRSTGSSGTLSYYPDEDSAHPNGSCTGNPVVCDRSATFAMRQNVAIYAGFSTGSETLLSQRNPYLQAILSGDLEKDFSLGDPFASGDLSDNAYHVVTADRVNPAARLDGFLIKSGNASGSGTDGKGGGLWLFWGGGTIVRCTFQYNRAATSDAEVDDRGGGAMHVDGSESIFGGGTPRVASCSFVENQALHKGAALSMYGGALDMANCVFRGNVVTTATTGLGGAIYLYPVSAVAAVCNLYNCTLFANTAASGPSAHLDGTLGELNVRNSILWNNSTSNPIQSPIAGTTSDAHVTYRDVEGGFTGTGNIDSNPFLNTSLDYDEIPPQYGPSP